ncbi:hypothetical protein FRACYDRAFT_238192 [Fragilariopsis cylindrus CCMP1102]|uniref:Uncharacterized protein n=1 Tax=Fragilariopsis cylindrus CCMP1102 TaxID=635003 RepID=A0A1E7FHZ9_9STRA|nr:hypothetical protein FRACYDRAFT_238192 [Fragilariopsis cylindrus CCMP1102]|eukprot:OEU17767.1 hypothetical protein FRACYDRAFT_238192 [Fragilariopsis cylindrus CCMP1102]
MAELQQVLVGGDKNHNKNQSQKRQMLILLSIALFCLICITRYNLTTKQFNDYSSSSSSSSSSKNRSTKINWDSRVTRPVAVTTTTTTSTESDGSSLILSEQQQKDQKQQLKIDKRREKKHQKKREERQQEKQRLRRQDKNNITATNETTNSTSTEFDVVINSTNSSLILQEQQQKDPKQKQQQRNQKNRTTPTAFTRYDDVVIVTKIHGPGKDWNRIMQSLCLLHYAYNSKVEYPILIFTTLPIPELEIQELQSLLGDKIQISVALDNNYNGSLPEMIYALPEKKRNTFFKNCNVTSPEELEWNSACPDNNNGDYPSNLLLSYNWQAEFRSVHIWNHHSLLNYKYMLWIDSDGFATAPWKNDPVEYLIENNGVVMFDNIQGSPRGLITLIFQSYNNSFICDMKINTTTGYLERRLIDFIPGNYTDRRCIDRLKTIHGFFHITNLDFYRSQVTKFLPLLGDCFLCRSPDDQLAVILPAIYYKPHKAFDMRSSGFNLKIFHNSRIDGKEKPKWPGFIKHWKEEGGSQNNFPEEVKICPIQFAS